MIAPWTFRPSMELVSDDSGMKREVVATCRLLIGMPTRRWSAGEEPTMRPDKPRSA
jgi:hypothetical protein